MKRRNFISTLATGVASFFILPSAGKVWRATDGNRFMMHSGILVSKPNLPMLATIGFHPYYPKSHIPDIFAVSTCDLSLEEAEINSGFIKTDKVLRWNHEDEKWNKLDGGWSFKTSGPIKYIA